MSFNEFLGGAVSTTQVDTVTPATVQIADIFTLTLTAEDNSTTETVSFTATVATVANVTAGLTAAVNALANSLTSPMFGAVAATDNGTNLTISARTPGVPFYLTSSTTDGGGANTQTLVRAASTANSGPRDWNTALNWSLKAVPASSDEVLISGRAANEIIYGLNQASVTLTRLIIDLAMAFNVGTILYALKIGATLADIGAKPADNNSASGSSLINLNFGSVQNTTIMRGSNNTGTAGRPPVQIVGTHASNKVAQTGGVLGFGTATVGQAGTLLSVVASKGSLVLGTAVSLTATNTEIDNTGATIVVNSAAKLIKHSAGTTTINGTGLVSTLDARGTGVVYVNNRPSDSISIAALLSNSNQVLLDFRGDPRVATVTATTIGAGQICQVVANNTAQVTFTDGRMVLNESTMGATSASPAN